MDEQELLSFLETAPSVVKTLQNMMRRVSGVSNQDPSYIEAENLINECEGAIQKAQNAAQTFRDTKFFRFASRKKFINACDNAVAVLDKALQAIMSLLRKANT